MIYFYVYELILWFVLMLFVIIFFRKMTVKIKNTDDPRSKNSLFVLMMIIGLPLLLFAVIAPVVVLMGDHAMPLNYKLAFGGEILIVLIYFISTQRHKKNPS